MEKYFLSRHLPPRSEERERVSESKNESESDNHTADRPDSKRGTAASVQPSEEWSTDSEIQRPTCGRCGTGGVRIENGKWFGKLVKFKGIRLYFYKL